MSKKTEDRDRLIGDPPDQMLDPEQVADEQAKNEARFQRIVAKARQA